MRIQALRADSAIASFDCGSERMTKWLKRAAHGEQIQGRSRSFVAPR